MATTLRATSTASGATGAVSIAAPAGTAAGDLVIVEVVVNAGVTNPPADNNTGTAFTDKGQSVEDTNGTILAVFARLIQGGDPSTYAFTNPANSRWSAIARAWQSPHADLFDVAPAFATPITSGTSINAPSITTLTANAIHVCGAGPDGAGNSSTGTPAGYTATTVNTNQAVASAYKVIAAAGATGAQTFTYTSSNSANAVSYAVKDVGGGGGGRASKNTHPWTLGMALGMEHGIGGVCS